MIPLSAASGDIGSSSLTDAGQRLSRSAMLRRLGSASAWTMRSGCRVCQAQTEVVRPQLLDRRKLAEHVEGSADAATGAADQVAVQTDQLAIAAAQSGSLDVPA